MSVPPGPPRTPPPHPPEEASLESVRRRLNSLDARTVVHFGVKPQERFARLENRLLGRLQEPETERVERGLEEAAGRLQTLGASVRRFLRGYRPDKPPRSEKRRRFLALYSQLSVQLIQLMEALAEFDQNLARSAGDLGQAFEEIQDLLRQLGWHIQAGEQKLAGPDGPPAPIRPGPAPQTLAGGFQPPEETRHLFRHRLSGRLRDLALTRVIARQTALQLGILENRTLAVRDRLQPTVAEMMPLLRQLILTGLSILETGLALEDPVSGSMAAARPLLEAKTRLLREEAVSLDQLETLKPVNAQLISLIAKLSPPED